jgi:hypothetical protein
MSLNYIFAIILVHLKTSGMAGERFFKINILVQTIIENTDISDENTTENITKVLD